MAIGITGATGQLGRLVIDSLTKRFLGPYVVALARSPEKAEDLDVAVREANYEDPATLGPALAGVTTLLLISSSEEGRRVQQHQNVIDAAKRIGVERIIYTSILHADRSPIGLAHEHLQTELDLKTSGLAYTILRNGWYSENYRANIRAALATGALTGSAGQGRICMASRADYAMAAFIALISGGHNGKTYELAGDSAWTMTEFAAEVSRQTGRNIPYRDLSEELYATMLTSAGLPAILAKAIAGWDTAASQDALFDDGRQLSKLIGRPTTPLPAAIAEMLLS
jgi:NAD(P)H dehydrogenase (quinone)